jgi:hypothetical protein
MQLPWRNQTGLAKLAAILAAVLGIAFGLCGANFVAVMKFVPFRGPTATPVWVSRGLMVTAYLELAVMILSAAGLILIGAIAITRAIKNHFTYN